MSKFYSIPVTSIWLGSLSEIHTIDNHSQQIWEYHCSKTCINIILLKKEKFNPHKQYCSCPHSTKQEVQSVMFPSIKITTSKRSTTNQYCIGVCSSTKLQSAVTFLYLPSSYHSRCSFECCYLLVTGYIPSDQLFIWTAIHSNCLMPLCQLNEKWSIELESTY